MCDKMALTCHSTSRIVELADLLGCFLFCFVSIDIMLDSTRTIKNKIFKQGIGIAEKSQKTRRDRWGGNVNHKYLF